MQITNYPYGRCEICDTDSEFTLDFGSTQVKTCRACMLVMQTKLNKILTPDETDYFATDKWHPKDYEPTDKQVGMWVEFKRKVLNPIRRKVGRPVRITSGVRTQADRTRLLAQGYHPSDKSDHYWGDIDGTDYALDITVDGFHPSEYLVLMEEFAEEDAPYIKQVILEHNAVRQVFWLHISIKDPLTASNKPKFMLGLDGEYGEYKCL